VIVNASEIVQTPEEFHALKPAQFFFTFPTAPAVIQILTRDLEGDRKSRTIHSCASSSDVCRLRGISADNCETTHRLWRQYSPSLGSKSAAKR